MRRTLRAIVIAFLLLAPAVVFGAAPGFVTGITAEPQANGTLLVRWKPAEGEIAQYRVYWSTRSIVGNAGAFDDVESTLGPVTEIALSALPAAPEIFVSVIAVNAAGEESAGFAEEATARRTIAEQDTGETAAMEGGAGGGNDALRLLSARAASATAVELTFSLPVVLAQTDAARAFHVRDGAGNDLAITRIAITEERVTLTTAQQETGKAYQVSAESVITGKSGAATVALDPLQSVALFSGTAGGVQEAVPAAAQYSWSPEQLQQLQQWQQTYVAALQAQILGQQATQSTRKASTQKKTTIKTMVMGEKGGGKTLPGTGIGLGVALALCGAAMGWRRVRRARGMEQSPA